MSKKILLTGGTGFFGKSILDMVRRKELTGYDLTILSRDPQKFLQNFPEFDHLPHVSFIAGDVRDFRISGSFDAMILGATPALTTIADEEMRSIIIDGTAHSLAIARQCGVKKLLFLSSGAVYGRQSVPQVPEDAPSLPLTVYGAGKLEAEKMCFASGIPAVVARCFAFTGKYLNRHIHFAIGNFIADALAQKEIVIKGDGTPLRSYLHADDLVIWLFNLLEKGGSGKVYNVGSDRAVSIGDLARQVAQTLAPGVPVKIMQSAPAGTVGQPYVPDISLSRQENLSSEKFPLTEAIRYSV